MIKDGKKIVVPPHEPESPLMGPEDFEKDIETIKKIKKKVKEKREKAERCLKEWGL